MLQLEARAVALIADYVDRRGFGRVVGLKSVVLCGRYGEVHCNRDWDLEMFRTCIWCQADLGELALELYCEQEAEG